MQRKHENYTFQAFKPSELLDHFVTLPFFFKKYIIIIQHQQSMQFIMWLLVTDLFVKFLKGRRVKGGVTKVFESADQEK